LRKEQREWSFPERKRGFHILSGAEKKGEHISPGRKQKGKGQCEVGKEATPKLILPRKKNENKWPGSMDHGFEGVKESKLPF